MASGALMLAELWEQPGALRRLLESGGAARVARLLRERSPRLVRLAAHGSSDNAASYGVYAFGLLAGATALRDSISLGVYYRAELDLGDSAVVAVSQSGETPDVVAYLERARERGAFTIALTNEPGSSLARAADAVLELEAGPERAVAATKTYTSSLAALALLAGHLGGRGDEVSAALAVTADRVEEALEGLRRSAELLAAPFVPVGRMFVIGRGVELATAREIALKLLETCRVAAEPLSATDLAHGPLAALDPLFPVWVVATDDPTLRAVTEAARRALAAGATVVASGPAAGAVEGAHHRLPAPRAGHPVLQPIASVVPGQLFAWALARARGLDPDSPAGLAKVTSAP